MKFQTFDFITEVAQEHGGEFAYIDEAKKVTFLEFEIGTRKIAGYLKALGIKEKDIVATNLPTYFSWFFTFSLHRMGVGVITKNSLSNFSQDLLPDFLISLKYHTSFPKDKTIIVDAESMRKIENNEPDLDLRGYSDSQTPARFFSTSGTTGGLRYISYLAHELQMLADRKSAYDLVGSEKVLSLYPFGSGQNYRLALKRLSAGKTHYAINSESQKIIQFISENGIRTLSGSPTQVVGFLDLQEHSGIELPKLDTVILGGSPPSEKLVQRLKNLFDCRIYNSYGSTEAGNIGLIEITGGVEKSSGFKIIHEDIRLEIVDDSDADLPAMSVGHVRYRRKDMATSYFNNPIATAQFFKDGYFYPGDLGFIDKQGHLHLEGRSTAVINLGGVKLNPERLESIALAQVGVTDCAVFGRIGQSGVEELCLALVVDAQFDQKSFESTFCSKVLNPIGLIRIVRSIPRNENGKIQRELLQ